jgi:hypothetical protein
MPRGQQLGNLGDVWHQLHVKDKVITVLEEMLNKENEENILI